MELGAVLLYLAAIYLRPGEVIPGWEGFPFVAILAVLSSFTVVLALVLRPRSFWNQPHDRYVLGFFAAALISNIAWGWFGGAYQALTTVAPAILCYVLLRASVQSARHLRWVGYTLVALTLFQAANGISEFWSGTGLGGVSAVEVHAISRNDVDMSDGTEEEAPETVRRIRGTGIFNDPNDLAMAFVVVIPFLLGPMLRRRSPFSTRAIASVVALPILAALFYTNSRGGMLGLVAVLAAYCLRLGKAAGVAMAVVGLTALLALAPSRMGQIDTEESSAQGRVQSWSEGLQMFKSRPVFGVGFGQYTEFNELVAHNSFVHTLAELGFVGAFFFVGMIYWLFRGMGGVFQSLDRDPRLWGVRAWGEDLRNANLGWCVSAMFLSRQYNVVLFIWLALSACYHDELLAADPTATRGETLRDVATIGVATVGGILAVYVIVRVLVVWGG